MCYVSLLCVSSPAQSTHPYIHTRSKENSELCLTHPEANGSVSASVECLENVMSIK